MTGPDINATPGGWRKYKLVLKPLLVITCLVAGLLIVAVSPLKTYFRHVEVLQQHIQALGVWGTLIYMLVVFVCITIGMPRLLFCVIGGVAFGFVWGMIWTQIPTLAGYYVVFLFARWGGRDFVIRHWPKLAHMHKVFHRQAVPKIIVIRQLPISGVIINLFLGLSPISHFDFLAGTAIGLLPEAIPMTAVGSSALELTAGQELAYAAGLLVLLVVVWFVFTLIVRSSKMFARMREDFAENELLEAQEGQNREQ